MADPYVSQIEVGVNCYVDIDDADEYLSFKYGADAWDALTDEVKDKLLISATRKIDRLPLRGKKRVYTQDLGFPRYFDNYYDIAYMASLIYVETIPEEVEKATCEEAFAMMNTKVNKRKELQRQGVKAFSIGRMSETFGGGSSSSTLSLVSEEAKELLRPWLAGAVKIR